MSLKACDDGMLRKLQEVYDNVVFCPLSQALGKSHGQNDELTVGGVTRGTKDSDDYHIEHRTNENEVAQIGVTDVIVPNQDTTGAIALPMICIDRLSNPFGTEFRANDIAIRRGFHVNGGQTQERAFPVTPTYQIDIISDRRTEVDEIWRELVMYLYLNPLVRVEYNEGEDIIEYEYPIKLMDTENVNDVEEFSDRGRIYRQTISCEVTNVQMIFRKDISLIERIPIREVIL